MAGYFGQTYELRFENGAWLDITNYIDSRQTKVTDIGCTEELKGGISTCKVELRYGDKKNKPLKQHSKIVGKLLAAKANNELVQFRMSGQVDFVGKIDLGNFSQTNSRIPGFITLDCEDNSYLLNEMMESFEYPDNSDLADIGYTIFDENNKSTSIVVQRLLASGYALSDIDFNASDNITELVRRIAYAEDENTTYRDFLNTLLFEHCAILYMRGDGKFVVKRLYKSNPVAIRDVDFAQKNGITTQAGNYQSDGEVVAWSTLSLDTERNIYVSNISLSRDDDGKFVGEEIQPNHYWPPDGDIEETWQEYNANFLDRPYTTKESRLRNKDISIISAKNVQAEIIKDNEMIIANNPPEIEPKRARFLFYNNDSVNVKKMYAFALKGDVLYRSKRNESTYPVGSRIPNDPYESTYLYNADGATRLVNHLYRFRKYGDIKHRWVEFRDVPNVFDIVTVSAPDTHISTLAMVLSRNITIVTPDTIKAEIGAVSITPFNSEPPKTRSVALGRLPVETGLDGAPGPKVVIQYALGTEEAPYSDKGNLLGTDDTLVGTDISLVGVEGGNIWTDSVPSPSEGEYVWRREGQYTPPAVWPKVWEVTRLTGRDGEDSIVIELTKIPENISISSRGDLKTKEILIRAYSALIPLDNAVWIASNGVLNDVEISPGVISIDTKILDCTTVEHNSLTVTVKVEIGGDEYSAVCYIQKEYETPIYGIYLGPLDEVPNTTIYGSLIDGDHFLYTGETGSAFIKYHVYLYEEGSWVETTAPRYIGSASADALDIASKTGEIVYCAVAYMDILYTNVIHVQKELTVNYQEVDNSPTRGMKVGADGILKAKEAVLVDAHLEGLIYSDPLTTQRTVASALTAPAIIPSNTLWSEADFYINFPANPSNVLQNVVFSHGGHDYIKATKLSSSSLLHYHSYTSDTKSITDILGGNKNYIGEYVVPANMPNGDNGANTVRVEIVAGWHIAGIPIIELWRGGTMLASGTQSVYSRAINNTGDYLRAGDVIKCYWESSAFTIALKVYMTGRTSSIATYSGIVGLDTDNNTRVVAPILPTASKYHNFAFETTNPVWNINSHLTRKSGSEILLAVSSFPLDEYVQATGTVNDQEIVGVKRSSNYVQFFKSNGASIIIDGFIDGTSVGVYSVLEMSVIDTFAQKEAVITTNIYPKQNGEYDLGQIGVVTPNGTENRYYRDLYLTGKVNADTINTGQGDFKIGQNLRITDNVEFASSKGVIAPIGVRYDENHPPTNITIINAQAGDRIIFLDTETKAGAGQVYTKAKEVSSIASGTVTVVFKAQTSGDDSGYYARVYINGTAVGTERTLGDKLQTFSQNFSVSIGDLIQIYLKSPAWPDGSPYIHYFAIATKYGLWLGDETI